MKIHYTLIAMMILVLGLAATVNAQVLPLVVEVPIAASLPNSFNELVTFDILTPYAKSLS